MSFLGSFVGAVLAIPFAIAAASNIVTNRAVVFIVRLFLSLVRTLPAGMRPDRHIHFRPRHDGRYVRHCGVHLCLCGQAAL